jgi:hypothetical protein
VAEKTRVYTCLENGKQVRVPIKETVLGYEYMLPDGTVHKCAEEDCATVNEIATKAVA